MERNKIIENILSKELKTSVISEFQEHWNTKKIKSEVLEIIQLNEGSDVNYSKHATNWTNPYGKAIQYNLVGKDGYADFNNNSDGLYEPWKYPLLNELHRSFQDSCISFRINILGANSGLGQHSETIVVEKKGKLYLKARFHLPLSTNPESYILLDGFLYQYEEGGVYYFNNSCVHAAKNEGSEDRIHLVWDVFVTKDVESLLSISKKCSPMGKESIDSDAPIDGDWDFEDKPIEYYDG